MSTTSWEPVEIEDTLLPVIAPAENALSVLQPREVQDAHDFINQLYRGVVPAQMQLADGLHTIGQRVLGRFLHLQKHLPAKLNRVLKEAEQVQKLLGAHVVDSLAQASFSEEDIANLSKSLTRFGRSFSMTKVAWKTCSGR